MQKCANFFFYATPPLVVPPFACHRKMGEIHELFVLALSLVWFAEATPENLWQTHLRSGRVAWMRKALAT